MKFDFLESLILGAILNDENLSLLSFGLSFFTNNKSSLNFSSISSYSSLICLFVDI